MTSSEQAPTRNFKGNRGLAGALAFLLVPIALALPAQAQTVTVLYNFTGGADGRYPAAGLTTDAAGNFYGTTSEGGYFGSDCGPGCGAVFKLERKGSSWVLFPIYQFHGFDGYYPEARVIFGPDGSLYGTTTYGGLSNAGEVFRLQPPATACKSALCPWNLTVLHAFTGGADGGHPQYGDVVFDQAGNLYGTTPSGGDPVCNCGVVYELSPSSGGWTQTVLHSFQQSGDGEGAFAGVTFDRAGNIYGTTVGGGASGQYGLGTIYKLTPAAGGWTESILYSFSGEKDGGYPYGGLIIDASGNLYGVNSSGVVYELSPASGGWTFTPLYTFNNVYEGSFAAPVMDPAGNLYGTLGIANQMVFRLNDSGGHWTLTGFTYNGSGTDIPIGNVTLDASGNVYTTASFGGKHVAGYIFEITP